MCVATAVYRSPNRGSQLDTVLNWDKKIEKINNNLTNKKMMRRSGSEIISPTTNRRNNKNKIITNLILQ